MIPGRFGWLGGTFDPIHCGHVDLAAAARSALGLERVYLVPAGIPPHRTLPHAAATHRLAMATLVADACDWLSVSDVELMTTGPSYTVDTLLRLSAQGTNMQAMHVIVGADAFADILSWKDAPRMLDLCHFVAVSRPGFPAPELRQSLPGLATRMVDAGACTFAEQPSIFLVDAPTAPVTATDVRARVSTGRSLEGIVPPAVADYITRHDLYRGVA